MFDYTDAPEVWKTFHLNLEQMFLQLFVFHIIFLYYFLWSVYYLKPLADLNE